MEHLQNKGHLRVRVPKCNNKKGMSEFMTCLFYCPTIFWHYLLPFWCITTFKRVEERRKKHEQISKRNYAGGCIAGVRRYLHINAEGDVETCVFIHYSNANIHEVSLLDALKALCSWLTILIIRSMTICFVPAPIGKLGISTEHDKSYRCCQDRLRKSGKCRASVWQDNPLCRYMERNRR